MNILYVSSKTNHQGGGSTSERMLLRYLNDYTDHSIDHISAEIFKGSTIDIGPFEVRQLAIGKKFTKHIENRVLIGSRPDVILSQGIYFPQAGEVASRYKIPHIVFIRDQFYRCPVARHNKCVDNCFNCVSWDKKLMWPLVKKLVHMKRQGIDNATLILANSQFMKRDINKRTETPVRVLYPPIEYLPDLDEGTFDKIVYMGCGFYKGTKLVMQLAKRLPEYEFLVSGDPEIPQKWDLSDYPNVQWSAWSDRDILLRSARIHICPSYWPEPFGRIPIEAGSYGVPSISSNRGGLPESVGPGGILLDPDDIDRWEKHIKTLMEPGDAWEYLSWKALEHSLQFDISGIGHKLEKYLEDWV